MEAILCLKKVDSGLRVCKLGALKVDSSIAFLVKSSHVLPPDLWFSLLLVVSIVDTDLS